jgi:hypothetical protein
MDQLITLGIVVFVIFLICLGANAQQVDYTNSPKADATKYNVYRNGEHLFVGTKNDTINYLQSFVGLSSLTAPVCDNSGTLWQECTELIRHSDFDYELVVYNVGGGGSVVEEIKRTRYELK